MLREKRKDPEGLSGSPNQEFSEEDINEAIRQSLAEHAAERNAQVVEKQEVDRAMAASIAGLLKTQLYLEDPQPVPSPITPPIAKDPEVETPTKGCGKEKTKKVHYLFIVDD